MSKDEKAGWVAGGAVLVAIALGGAAMAVVRRVVGRSPHLRPSDPPDPTPEQPAEEAVEQDE